MSRYIKLVNGQQTLVDDDIFAHVSEYQWYLSASHHAARCDLAGSTRIEILLDRVVMDAGDTNYVRHKNGNTLDNRRQNLTIDTTVVYRHGKRIRAPRKTSIYRGVHFNTQNRKWFASIRVDGLQRFLGQYATENEAALAYNKASLRFFGQGGLQNVIVDTVPTTQPEQELTAFIRELNAMECTATE